MVLCRYAEYLIWSAQSRRVARAVAIKKLRTHLMDDINACMKKFDALRVDSCQCGCEAGLSCECAIASMPLGERSSCRRRIADEQALKRARLHTEVACELTGEMAVVTEAEA